MPARLEHVLILGMDYGLVLFTSDRGITPAAAAKLADDHGFATFYVPEHTHIPVKRQAAHPTTGDESLPDDRYMRTLDPWVSLGTAAAVTSRVRLSTAVALPVEHDPITLAKSIATLDHLSGGRVSVGVGFGWNTDELADHNVPPGRRRTMLREYLEAMRALWTQEEASYDGEFVNFGPSWAWPKPVQSHIPVLVGAAGTEKNFKWIARSADGWITTPRDFDIDEPVKLLQDTWAAAGRDGAPQIVALDFKPDPEKLARWADLGVTEVLFGLPDKSDAEVAGYVERLARQAAAALRRAETSVSYGSSTRIVRPRLHAGERRLQANVARLPCSVDHTLIAAPSGSPSDISATRSSSSVVAMKRLLSASRRPTMIPVRIGQS